MTHPQHFQDRDRSPAEAQDASGAGAADSPHGGVSARPRPVRFIALVVAVAVTLLAVIAAGTVLTLDRLDRYAVARPGRAGVQSAGPRPVDPAPSGPSAPQVVRQYLEAVAAGDAKRALALGAEPPVRPSPLTQRLLTVTLRTAPLRDIEVPEVADPDPREVTASFTLGRRSHVEALEVVNTDDGWRLRQAYATLSFPEWFVIGSQLRVNGLAVDPNTPVAVLPGRYEIGSAHWAYDYFGEPTLVVTNPQLADLPPAEHFPTRAAMDAYRREVKRRLARCMQAKSLNTWQVNPQCPFGWRNTGKDAVRVASVRWSVVEPPRFHELGYISERRPVLRGTSAVALRTDITCRGPCYPGRGRRTSWYQVWTIEPEVGVRIKPELYDWNGKAVGRPVAR